MSHPTASDLAAVPLFAGMSEQVRSALADRFDVKSHRAGERAVTEGNSGYAFYVVHEGTLSVSRAGKAVRQLGPGDFFGEISIIGDGRHTATVTADGPALLWVMFGTRFRELQGDHPEAAIAVQAAMDARLAADELRG